jgi:hypothetical protein
MNAARSTLSPPFILTKATGAALGAISVELACPESSGNRRGGRFGEAGDNDLSPEQTRARFSSI